MENDLQQNRLRLKKDLIKIFVFFGLAIVLMTIVYFLDQKSGFLVQLSDKMTNFLISQ
jgi:hypothetical protein